MKFCKMPVEVEAITFDELIAHGKANGGNIVDGMPWSFTYKGQPISHENDSCYLIPTLEGTMKMTPEDMLITGVQGEIYPCKKEIFEKTYVPAEMNLANKRFDFGIALCHLKAGRRVARSGWNGKGMWLTLSAGNNGLPADSFWNPHNAEFARQNGGTAEVLPTITMKTADGKILMGWLASQTDMLANDWEVVD